MLEFENIEGGKIYFAPEHITVIIPQNDFTQIHTTTSGIVYNVMESPERIMSLLTVGYECPE